MASLCSDKLLRFKEKILQHVTMIYCEPFSLSRVTLKCTCYLFLNSCIDLEHLAYDL